MDKVRVDYYGFMFDTLFQQLLDDITVFDKPTAFAFYRYSVNILSCDNAFKVCKFKDIVSILVYSKVSELMVYVENSKVFLVYRLLKSKSFFNIYTKKDKTMYNMSMNQYILDAELEMKDRKLGIMFRRFFKYSMLKTLKISVKSKSCDIVIKIIQKHFLMGRVFTLLKEMLQKSLKNIYIFWYIPLTYFKKKLKKIKSIKKRLKKRLVYSDKIFLKKRFIKNL